jgi:predicted flavoprotein YhiN
MRATSAYTAPALIVATGGLSIPKIGATGFGYDIARQFGVPIETCRPALVPLTLSGAEHAHFADLTGVSAPVIASCGKRSFQEKMLFTHRGLSGPAILQISSYWKQPEAILHRLVAGATPARALAGGTCAARSGRGESGTARAAAGAAGGSAARGRSAAELDQSRAR